MMWCTVAFCMFPAGTSQHRWLKDWMMDTRELIPPPPPLCVFGSADVFPLTRTKGLCFCFQACPFLKGHRSLWSQGEAVTASQNIWRPPERDENASPARKLHRHLMITLSKDLLSICWCGWEHTANTLWLNYSRWWGCLGERDGLTLEIQTCAGGLYLLWDGLL